MMMIKKENNLDDASFPEEVLNTTNTNIPHDATDEVETEPH